MYRSIALTIALSGCSFALVSGPPANHRQLPAFNCTTSHVGPVLDVVWTGLQTLNFLFAATTTDAKWNDTFANNDPPFSRTTAIGLYAGLAALGGAGMYYGFTKIKQCTDARNELAVRQSQQPYTNPPASWPPPQVQPPQVQPPPPPPAPDARPLPEPYPAPPPATP